MKQIKSVDYTYATNGEVSFALIQYTDGTTENVSSKSRLIEVQNQLKFQQKQILMESN